MDGIVYESAIVKCVYHSLISTSESLDLGRHNIVDSANSKGLTCMLNLSRQIDIGGNEQYDLAGICN